MIGNIFFSFKEIDVNGDLFKSWVELTSPVWEMLGSDINDVVSQKRWLAFLGGGLLPIISLTSLHFFVKYDELTKEGTDEIKTVEVIKEVEKIVEVPVEIIVEKEVIKEVEKIVEVPVEIIVEKLIELPQSDLDDNEDYFDEGFEEITEEDIVDESPRPNRLSYIKPQS
jgi:hypothetical protein